MLQHVSVLHSLLLASNIPPYDYDLLFIHLIADGHLVSSLYIERSPHHLGYFHLLALMNNVMNIIYKVLYRHVFIFLGYTPRSGPVGLYGDSVFN